MVISALENIRLSGRQATPDEVATLESKFRPDFLPPWLIETLINFKLIGVTFTLSESDDASDMGADVFWLSPAQMLSEAFESQPGISVLGDGLFPVGACAIGTGDPYFIDLNAGYDPPLMRVLHEYIGSPDAVEMVSPRLSEFFRKATVD